MLSGVSKCCAGAPHSAPPCSPSSTAFFGYESALDAPFDETRLHLVCYQSMTGAKAAAGDLAVASLTCPLVRYRDGTLVKPKHTLLLIDMGATARYEASNSFCILRSGRRQFRRGMVNRGMRIVPRIRIWWSP
jgi:hypothetical protein